MYKFVCKSNKADHRRGIRIRETFIVINKVVLELAGAPFVNSVVITIFAKIYNGDVLVLTASDIGQ